ncbi:leucine rich repeat / protein phosphatase 2C domain containing protein [Entamoeba histolytica HM-1:IMSS-B]|uniref:Leucine rich repeat / protein phosphatase 2C domain containing protein n=6 Tax=Entamoeba histolytica TaxID=5759 RepID=C4M555_ENTH1|nr:leucine rich repeat / protein phosphatase 2C domain containing protein [Entamoeba histolytica HM-1:IMSS]EMD49038.1 PH domain leucinerich repeat-containing protein phosphatase [Entamoeba histolytica KU27]EMH74209.1 leucine rich repeat / protein phosphatase 2C domain containing protein [Entamoeba histolytica HM-1:IMSS-B]EMS14827.1 PH domain leucine-rich repeat-containing protein phosphatase [Entamoeba histolytica HM-3:IMSS]ENY62530.1 PH domain leucine-rich repeat-containing protein phosphatase|eukprot:XP_651492.1 leucine rich repeat / protein phosphatase 2C domain containing protein [Entamoeba histolytica HM-1:IMSS]
MTHQQLRIYKKFNENLSKVPSEVIKLGGSITTLDLSFNVFTEIPSLDRFKSLANLVMSSNKISILPSHLFKITSLKKLILSQNILYELPLNISTLSNLTCLNLSQNKLSKIPLSISSLVNLKIFSLSTNNLSTLPKNLSHLTSLTSFEIDHNKLTDLPECICEMSSLVTLNVSGNDIQKFPMTITKLQRLKTLTAQYIRLKELPSFFSKFPSLINLDVDYNPLTSMQLNSSSSIKNLTLGEVTLKSLSLQNYSKLFRLNILSGDISELNELPQMSIMTIENVHLNSILYFPDVNEVSLANNNLVNIPQLTTSLQTLNIRNNKIVSLPVLFPFQVTRLDLSQNLISTIPSLNTVIRTLLMTSNKIIEWPKSMKELTCLRHLDLSNNKIQFIPNDYISTLVNLEHLILHFNYLCFLPPAIGSLTKLKLLGLSHNRLTQFPVYLGTQLTSLMISSNSISVIPDYIRYLSLVEIDISYNQLVTLGPLLLNTTLKDINVSYNPLQILPSKINQTKSHRINISGYPVSNLELLKEKQEGPITVLTIQRENGTMTLPIQGYEEIPGLNDLVCNQISFCHNQIEFGLAECKGYRDEMQDFMCFSENFVQKGNYFAAICDGHSGVVTAQTCASKIMMTLENILKSNEQCSIKDSLIQAFTHINSEIIEKGLKDGTTCLCLVITENIFYIANTGDCRCLLIGDDYFLPLTVSHRPSNKTEYKRIRENGGFVIGNRTNGGLAVSRSLGDSANQPIISPIPDVVVRQKSSSDRYLVLACDGVWDVMSDEKVYSIIKQYSKYHPTKIANTIKDLSLCFGSTDNISCIVCKLN